MKLKKFTQFINEAGEATQADLAAVAASPEAISPASTSAVSTPSGLMIKAVYDKTKGGGLRVIGSKGNVDYEVHVALPTYKGPVKPVNFWKKGDTYYMKTNANQIQDFSQEDVNQLLALYKSGASKKTIDGWVADVTFIKTNDLKDIA
jgi:hypothetical protein